MLLCGVPTRNSAPIPSSTQNTNATRVGAQTDPQQTARSIPQNCRKRQKPWKWRKISQKQQNT